MKELKSNLGVTLLELLVGVLISGTIFYALGSVYLSFGTQLRRNMARTQAHTDYSNVMLMMSHIGRFARSCTREFILPSGLALVCQVEFVVGVPEEARFEFSDDPADPAAPKLSYVRQGLVRWSLPVESFDLCTGTDVIIGGCDDGGPSLSSSNLAVVSLAGYFRYRVVARILGSPVPFRGAFFSRNTAPGPAEYIYTPLFVGKL